MKHTETEDECEVELNKAIFIILEFINPDISFQVISYQ